MIGFRKSKWVKVFFVSLAAFATGAVLILASLLNADNVRHQEAQATALSSLDSQQIIEARYQHALDEIQSATEDVFLEDRVTQDLQIFPPELYIGCMGGYKESIFGTQRSFNEVVAEYEKNFSLNSGWKQIKYDEHVVSFSNERTLLLLVPFGFTKDLHPATWENFPTLYERHITYAEPSILHCTS